MPRLLNKLPGTRREAAGLEWWILRRLPGVLVVGTLLPGLVYLYATRYPPPAPDDSVEKYITGVAIAAIATVLTLWTAVFTAAIACCIVWVMKGPAYVADRYPLIDADAPRPEPPDRDQDPAADP